MVHLLAPPAHIKNRLLALLPAGESLRLLPKLVPVEFKFKQFLYRAGEVIEHVYFPTKGIASAVAYAGDAAIEVATVGDEGMVGVTALLGEAPSPNDVYVQLAGGGLRMSAAALWHDGGAGSPLYGVLARYMSAYQIQVSQSVACNGLHDLRQRCCRWLLTTQDRVHADELALTHEFLAVMLAVRRASVSEVLAPLQDEGLIRYHRGAITILDRAGLEANSCECYRIVADAYVRLLG